MRTLFAAAFALLVTLATPTQAVRADDACQKIEDGIAQAEAADWKVAKLDDADAKKVLADFNDDTGLSIEADAVYLATTTDAEGSPLDAVFFVKDGCVLMGARANVQHLQDVLGRDS